MELDERQVVEVHCVVTEVNIYPIKSCAGISLQTGKIGKFGFENDRKWMVVDAESGRMMTGRRFPMMVLIKPRFSEDSKYLIITSPNSPDLKIRIDDEDSKRPSKDVTVWASPATQAIDEGDEAAEWFTKIMKFNVRFVRYPNKTHNRSIDSEYLQAGKEELVGFADGFPYLLASEESLADLNSRLAVPLAMKRFRPNIVVKATKGGFPWMEDAWHGSSISINGATFRIAKWCERCKMTTLDPETGKYGVEPLKTLATFRQGLRKGGKEVTFGQNLVCEQITGGISVGQEISFE